MSESAAMASPPLVTEEAQERQSTTGSALRNALRLLVSTGSGKLGVALFAIMLIVSAYVLLTYPIDFGRARWSNPAFWADYPKAAPPVWTTWLGKDAYKHSIMTENTPASVTQRGAAEVRTFEFSVPVEGNQTPSFLTMTILGITFNERAPVVVATLVRPDGGEVRLANIPVRGPRAGETAPYRRYYDTPERFLLTEEETASQSIVQVYDQLYPNVARPDNFASNLKVSLFGVPDSTGSGTIIPLDGDYTLKVDVLVANPNDETTGIRAVAGGTVYGVMGTDAVGRNLWEGLLYGLPIALLIATVTAIISTIIGASLGILSGYAGGKTDSVIQRLCDIISNVPLLPLLIFLVFIIGPHLWLVMLVLVAFSWTGLTILVRSMVLQIRSGQLVEAAQAMGASRTRIMFKHIFPQVAPFIVAQMIFFAPAAILAEASLSFLGLGDPSIPTWGQMLQAGFQTGALYVGYWWWVIAPGIFIIVTALAFMLLALAMESIVDPRLRSPG
jgi:peptide/nickel transport system permease protein